MSDLTVQPPETSTSATYALLIGVDDYDNLDEVTAAHDLKGSKNDVLLLARYCLTVLRMPIENIRMLTSSRFTDVELNVLIDAVQQEVPLELAKLQKASGEAHRAEVNNGVGWLLESTKAEDTALLSFSGHGWWSEKTGPVLCLGDTKLGDTTAEGVDGVLPLRELQGRIERAGARSRLIAVLDCCHVTGAAPHRRLQTTGIPHTGTAKDVADDDQDFNVSDRVLLAAQPGKPAHQMRFGMHWHGALTFALVTTAERWLATNGASHGSYKQVWKRAKEVVKALEVPQTPMMKVPAAKWIEIREEPFLGVKAGDTVKEPDAAGSRMQLPSDWLITIRLGTKDGTILAQIVTEDATNNCKVSQGTTDQATFGPGSLELWYINTDALESLQSTEDIVIISTQLTPKGPVISANLDPKTKFSFGGGNACSPTFTSAEVNPLGNPWRTGGSISFPSTTSYYFTTSDIGPALGMQLVVPAPGSTNPLTAVVWYQVFSKPTSAPIDIQPGSSDGVAYKKSGTVPIATNVAWFAVSAPGT